MCKYKNSYIRGWFDGDGCVSRFKNHSLLRLFFSINSQCEDLVKIYQEFIENNNFFLIIILIKEVLVLGI